MEPVNETAKIVLEGKIGPRGGFEIPDLLSSQYVARNGFRWRRHLDDTVEVYLTVPKELADELEPKEEKFVRLTAAEKTQLEAVKTSRDTRLATEKKR